MRNIHHSRHSIFANRNFFIAQQVTGFCNFLKKQGEVMSYLKKIGLLFTAFAFCLTLSITASYGQPGKAKWKGNNGQHRGWTTGQRNGWTRGRKTGWNYRRDDDWRQTRSRSGYWQNTRSREQYYQRNSRISPQEYRRLQRQRARINRNTGRFYRDGYLSDKERRRLQRQYYKYRRNVYRDRRDW
jgi:hypothetical protein